MKQLQIIFFSAFLVSWIAASTPTCTNGFTLVNNKCLKLFTNVSTYRAAEKSCMDYGATLVTAKNSIDNRAITTFVGSAASLIWIGLYCLDSSPSRCLWDDSTGAADTYNSFSSGFPLVDIGKCVYYSTQGALAGKWLSGDCDKEPRAYVCELPSTHADDCPYNYNGYCYTFSQSSSAFAGAQTQCELNCGNLASITSANENRYITTVSRRLGRGSVLIGGMWPSTNVFSWVDGSVWSYNNIDPFTNHTDNCMVMSNAVTGTPSAGSWTSVSCSSAFSYLCKRPAGLKCTNPTYPSVTVTPVPSNPSNCNSSLLLAPGIITSPNYPYYYDNNVRCSYYLATLGSYNILLKFTNFWTEQTFDWVAVNDGDTTANTLLGNYSGTLAPFNVVSTGNTATVTFSTDRSNVYPGFSARFTPFAGCIAC
ncbi:hypothetical protein L5515_015607 [Caenorhabditis briggsae]|uniref:C-type LECtin n=1 Tax=Caenorhabditis briggsae TaxID=6238 RepID=A0AAE9EF43_CAEBR|nr:hypothetical protein L5515_015607 [Caenorhabditis briggsae]